MSKSFLPRHSLNKVKLNKKNFYPVHANVRKTENIPKTENTSNNLPREATPVYDALLRRHRRNVGSGKLNGPGQAPGSPGPITGLKRSTITGAKHRGKQGNFILYLHQLVLPEPEESTWII